MTKPLVRVVFISYSRKDGQDLAHSIKHDLESAGFSVWLDTEGIRGGASWTTEVETALTKCDVLLAVLTPACYQSEWCRAEQIWALEERKLVIPVIAAPGAEVPVHLMSRNWRRYPEQRAQLLADIAGESDIPLTGFAARGVQYDSVPSLPQNYIARPDLVAKLREVVFTEGDGTNIAVSALKGMGGIGKTVLAIAWCRDTVVRRAFPDGIAWMTLGRESTTDWPLRMREVARALGDDTSKYDTDIACESRYRALLREKAALVVIDDVWDVADLERLLVEAPRSRFVFTTRDSGIANAVAAREYAVDLLTEEEARSLLAKWAGVKVDSLPQEAAELITECGHLALAIAVIGASLRSASAGEWGDALDLLKRADVSTIEERLPKGQKSFFRSLEISLQSLAPHMRKRYLALAVLVEDLQAPLAVLQTLWRASTGEARRTARLFVDRSLAWWEQTDHEGIRLHDLQVDYVRAKHADRDALSLIHSAIRLSSNVILHDPVQFASQVIGRLLPHQGVAAIEQFTSEIREGALVPWLRPLWSALHPPGTPLIRTLEGHLAYVNGVALTPDGRCAVSASEDKTLKVWDLETGRALRTLEGHSFHVNAVAVSPDGRRAISASWDNTLRLWDLETGRTLRTFEGHSGAVLSVAVTPDGRRAISASHDNTLKVWDLQTGQTVRTLEGHSAYIYDVAVSPNGRLVVSASRDSTLKVWDLETGNVIRTLTGHSAHVLAVAVSPDGRRVISASADKTLRVWDLETGGTARLLEGHSAGVSGVAMTPDGRRAVSASRDKTLLVWDLETGGVLRRLEGHSASVYGIAVSPDGRRAVSASADKTLKVWDLETKAVLSLAECHSALVNAVGVSADGRRAVSASWDNTLKVWDLETGRTLWPLEGNRAEVNGVAVSSDGRWAISAFADMTLKVWDLETGRALRTLMGHSASVNDVAITPDGRWAVSASSDTTLKIWDLETGGELRTLKGHSGPVNAVAMNAGGRLAVSASADNTLKVWDLQTGHALYTLEGHSGAVTGIAMSSDDRFAVSASWDNTLKVWDLDTGEECRTLRGHSNIVKGVALTARGRRAVSASYDNTIKLWDFETGALLTTFTCDASALCCAFVNDRKLIAGDSSGRVHLFSLEEVVSQ